MQAIQEFQMERTSAPGVESVVYVIRARLIEIAPGPARLSSVSKPAPSAAGNRINRTMAISQIPSRIAVQRGARVPSPHSYRADGSWRDGARSEPLAERALLRVGAGIN